MITDQCVLDFGEDGEAVLAELHPGCTVESVKAACGWDLKVAKELRPSKIPDAQVIKLMREKLDPKRLYL